MFKQGLLRSGAVFIALLFLSAAPSEAQRRCPDMGDWYNKLPHISCSATNFGDLPAMESHRGTLVIGNTGKGTLVINSISQRDPEHFRLTMPPLPLEIGEGSSFAIRIEFRADEEGEFSDELIVGSNAYMTNASVRLNANTYLPHLLSTGIALGRQHIGAQIKAYISVVNTGKVPALVDKVRIESEGFSAVLEGITLPFTLKPYTETWMPVKMRFDNAGSFSGSITVSGEKQITATAGFSAVIYSSGASLEGPEQISLGKAELNSEALPFTATLAATNHDIAECAGPVQIQSVELIGGHEGDFSLEELSLPALLQPGEKFTVKGNFSPRLAGERRAELRIVTNADNRREFRLALDGTGIVRESAMINLVAAPGSNPRLDYSVSQDSHTDVEVFSAAGERMMTLSSGEQAAGIYSLEISTENLPAGIYFVKVQSSTGFFELRPFTVVH